jgi:diacylglycerol O-acyltransferase
MDRLSALDAMFLYAETPEMPMHVAILAVFASGATSENLLVDLRDQVKRQIPLIPFFSRRISTMPLQFDHPVWVMSDDIDLEYHIRHTHLPSPGSTGQLNTLVTRLHMAPLDRARPLWQFYLIEGLQDGGFAVYMKMHHAAIDGKSGMSTLDIIFGASAKQVATPSDSAPRKDDPNIFDTLRISFENILRQQQRFIEALPDISNALGSIARRVIADFSKEAPLVALAPKTMFNVSVSNQRSFGTCSISLSEVKTVGKSTKSTVNDVVLTICAGALRRYLELRHELPEQSLVGAVPVSLRKPGNADMNNQVTVIMCDLATNVVDPILRLQTIRRSVQEAKAFLGEVRGALMNDISWWGMPLVITGLSQLMNRTQLASRLPTLVNLAISNVPGPKGPLEFAGAKMVKNYPMSIAGDGAALNVTVHSHLDNLDFGLIACRNAVPDVQTINNFIVDEFENLKRVTSLAVDRSGD